MVERQFFQIPRGEEPRDFVERRRLWTSGSARFAATYMIQLLAMMKGVSPQELLLKICPMIGPAQFAVLEKTILKSRPKNQP